MFSISNIMSNAYKEKALLFRPDRNNSGFNIIDNQEEPEHVEYSFLDGYNRTKSKTYQDEKYRRSVINVLVIPNLKEYEKVYKAFGDIVEGQIVITTQAPLFTIDDIDQRKSDILYIRKEYREVVRVAYSHTMGQYTAKLNLINQDISYNDGIITF